MNDKISFVEYFSSILAIILKPFTAFKEKLNKFNVLKNSVILALIVSGLTTIINLVTSMFNVIRVKSFDWSSGDYKTTWVWDNLKELNYIEIIGKNFLICLGVIFAIAVVYYIASLIVKKQVNFSRLVAVSTFAIIPVLISSLILSPLASLIWIQLAMPIVIIGAMYTFVLLYEGMNNEVALEGDIKYYFNLICLSILLIAGYYLCVNLVMSSITSELGDALEIFS